MHFAWQVSTVGLSEVKKGGEQQAAVTGKLTSGVNCNASMPDVEASERGGFHLPGVTCLSSASSGLGDGVLASPPVQPALALQG